MTFNRSATTACLLSSAGTSQSRLASKARRTLRALLKPVRISKLQDCEFEYLDSIRRERHFVFVTGMHRSGTTFLTQLLARHCSVSGFDDVPGDMNEGQFLQNVLPIESDFGGMGFFGYHPRSRMIEGTERRDREIGVSLLKDWLVYLDRNSDCFVEKTPSNFRISRLLAAAFPNSSFIHIVRHPIATALALKAFSPDAMGIKGRSPSSLVRHWLHCQQLALEDYRHVSRSGHPVVVMALEDMPVHGARFAGHLNARLGLGIDIAEFRQAITPHPNRKYSETYRKLVDANPELFLGRAVDRAVSLFGYSRDDLAAPPQYLDWLAAPFSA